jgi:hypothetical protein
MRSLLRVNIWCGRTRPDPRVIVRDLKPQGLRQSYAVRELRALAAARDRVAGVACRVRCAAENPAAASGPVRRSFSLFGDEIRAGIIKSPFDIADVWPSSYSANTNEILWGAKAAARVPWIAGVIRLASYECGMDQPTYSPVQQIVERSGTLFFSFQELDSTKPAGSVKIRVETIAHYLQKYAAEIIARKKAASPPGCPLARPNTLS